MPLSTSTVHMPFCIDDADALADLLGIITAEPDAYADTRLRA